MKIDMHCHTKEGSIDAKVPIEKYIHRLVEHGFDGMLVTDHNSYNGYRKFQEIASKVERELKKPFVVLKGIEYDTRDGGHVIAILPDHVKTTALEIKGMTIAQLERFVHKLGGVIGPAHPFGPGFFAFMNTHFGKNNIDFLNKFDFVEAFNACTKPLANMKAEVMAGILGKPKTAGSDAHKEHIIGKAFTEFNQDIRNNNDLIRAIKEGRMVDAGGQVHDKVLEKKNQLVEKLGVMGYWIYNKSGAWWNSLRLRKIVKRL
ncbi:MAG: PHP domain-containing protein [Lachnospira sp.]|nr:PHP domain-containing protein [Lachnospira sp.]